MEDCPERNLIDAVNNLTEVLNNGFERATGSEDASSEVKFGAIEMANQSVESSLRLTRDVRCQHCAGMVVDLSTGIVYCGRDVPQSVIDTNERIIYS